MTFMNPSRTFANDDESDARTAAISGQGVLNRSAGMANAFNMCTLEAIKRVVPPVRFHHIRHRSTAVCTGASHNAVNSSFNTVTVIEHPAMSSDVT